MELLLWMYVVPAFLTLCKLLKPIFYKLVVKKALDIANYKHRSNGKHHDPKDKK